MTVDWCNILKQAVSTLSLCDDMEVKGGLAPVAGYRWEQTIAWLCAVSMAHVCARCSGSWAWKARVSARRWLNDTTYCPNSHSGSCALFEKKQHAWKPKQQRIGYVRRLQRGGHVPGSAFWPPFDASFGLKWEISVYALIRRTERVFASAPLKTRHLTRNRAFSDSACALEQRLKWLQGQKW